MFLATLLCKIKGHKRGKRYALAGVLMGSPYVTYTCVRCGALWSRKVKAPHA